MKYKINNDKLKKEKRRRNHRFLGAASGRNQNNYYCQCLPKKSSFFGAPNLTFLIFTRRAVQQVKATN